MTSKRFKKLPTKTALLPATEFEKLITEVKKIVQQNLMSQSI